MLISMENLPPNPKNSPVITPDFIRQVAALAVTGATQVDIAEALGTTKKTVAKALALPETKDIMAEITEDAVAAAKIKLKSKISSLADAVYDALRYQIEKKKSVQAVQVALKVMGVEQAEDATGPGNITVYLPGVEQKPLTIEAKGKKVKDGSNGD